MHYYTANNLLYLPYVCLSMQESVYFQTLFCGNLMWLYIDRYGFESNVSNLFVRIPRRKKRKLNNLTEWLFDDEIYMGLENSNHTIQRSIRPQFFFVDS